MHLTTNRVAHLAGVSVGALITSLHRHGHWRGIVPTKMANGRLAWPADEVYRVLGIDAAEAAKPYSGPIERGWYLDHTGEYAHQTFLDSEVGTLRAVAELHKIPIQVIKEQEAKRWLTVFDNLPVALRLDPETKLRILHLIQGQLKMLDRAEINRCVRIQDINAARMVAEDAELLAQTWERQRHE